MSVVEGCAKSILTILGVMFGGLLLVVAVCGCGYYFVSYFAGKPYNEAEMAALESKPTPAEEKVAATPDRPKMLYAGGESILVARTSELNSRAIKLAVAGDNDGLMQMVFSGDAFLVDSGTKVVVIDRGVLTSEVRIQSGRMKGRSGFVSSDFIK